MIKARQRIQLMPNHRLDAFVDPQTLAEDDPLKAEWAPVHESWLGKSALDLFPGMKMNFGPVSGDHLYFYIEYVDEAQRDDHKSYCWNLDISSVTGYEKDMIQWLMDTFGMIIDRQELAELDPQTGQWVDWDPMVPQNL